MPVPYRWHEYVCAECERPTRQWARTPATRCSTACRRRARLRWHDEQNRTAATAASLEARVTKLPEAPGCWLWEGAVIPNGYGQIVLFGRPEYAHRAMWRAVHGAIEDGLFVCHRCDVRCCVRPDHLFLGSNADNVADMVQKGRQSRRLTPEQVRTIRARHAAGERLFVIASDYGITPEAVGAIVTRKNWRHVA